MEEAAAVGSRGGAGAMLGRSRRFSPAGRGGAGGWRARGSVGAILGRSWPFSPSTSLSEEVAKGLRAAGGRALRGRRPGGGTRLGLRWIWRFSQAGCRRNRVFLWKKEKVCLKPSQPGLRWTWRCSRGGCGPNGIFLRKKTAENHSRPSLHWTWHLSRGGCRSQLRFSVEKAGLKPSHPSLC